ncbi:MAG: UpxY family transcription antiterminator [Acidobacteria bacterium]|nr:UpxY family transcription antiterminator [Acidobacteriota bacterium]
MSAALAIQHMPEGSDQRALLFETAHWYAAYTCARHEKKVAAQLSERAVDCFLPLYATPRRWKNMRTHVHLPIFPGYVFVHLALRDRLRVLQTPGVARLVGFNGYPTPLPAAEVEAIRASVAGGQRVEPHPFLKAGRKVRINSGPFEGLEGILLRRKGDSRFILSLQLIMRSVAVEIDEADLELTSKLEFC